MSEKLINLNSDLQALRNEGYDIEIRSGYLVMHSVPYVNAKAEVCSGSLVSPLELSSDKTSSPITDHTVWFAGEFPCDKAGKPLKGIKNQSHQQTLSIGLTIQHRFSAKPSGGNKYTNYHEKMTGYVGILSNPAKALDPQATACVYRPIRASGDDSVFLYTDSASSRNGTAALNSKCEMKRVAIVGLGGTGSYILDLISKTHIQEIHLFDGDKLYQHNAFRAPGAASLDDLDKSLSKVHYYTSKYSVMRHGIYPHEIFLDETNLSELSDFDFVFTSVDKPAVRKIIFDYLIHQQIPFIDCGMELEAIEEEQCLIGDCRVTLVTIDKNDHVDRRISLGKANIDDIYKSNIQVVEMNALNATLAVLKWKKYCGFYQDLYKEMNSTYSLNTHQLTRDECLP
jgi:hypothetical protein